MKKEKKEKGQPLPVETCKCMVCGRIEFLAKSCSKEEGWPYVQTLTVSVSKAIPLFGGYSIATDNRGVCGSCWSTLAPLASRLLDWFNDRRKVEKKEPRYMPPQPRKTPDACMNKTCPLCHPLNYGENRGSR